MQFEHDKDMAERAKADKQEETSNSNTQEIMKGIFGMGGQVLGPVLGMLLGKSNPAMAAAMAGGGGGGMDLGAMMGGGGGGMGGMSGIGVPGAGQEEAFGMPGAMGVNPQDIIGMQMQNGGNPQWMAEPSDLFGVGTNMPPPQPTYQPPTAADQWRNYNPDFAAQQQQQYFQPQPQAQNTGWNGNTNTSTLDEMASSEIKAQYSVEDFSGDDAQTIAQKIQEGLQGRSSIDSFVDAARRAYQQAVVNERSQPVTQTPDVAEMRNDEGLKQMPSNVSIEPPQSTSLDDMGTVVTQSEDENLIQNRGNVGLDPLDELNQAEDLLSNNIGDLRVMPDTPLAPEEKKKIAVNRTALDDAADVV
jgi:hypothetical protein